MGRRKRSAQGEGCGAGSEGRAVGGVCSEAIRACSQAHLRQRLLGMATRGFSTAAKPIGESFVAPVAQPAVAVRGAWFALAMLCFIYVLNFLDRQLLSILAKPIQDTLHVTDSQLGLIGGLYFALFYCFISIPVGWLADAPTASTCCRLPARFGARRRWGADWLRTTAARRRADDGRLRRGGRRAAVLRDHLATYFRRAGAAPRSVSSISVRRSARRSALRSAPRSRRRSAGAYAFVALGAVGLLAALALRSHRARAETRRLRSSARRRSKSQLLRDISDVLLAANAHARRTRQRRHAVHHLWARQFRDALPDARKGHDARASRCLLRAGRRHSR